MRPVRFVHLAAVLLTLLAGPGPAGAQAAGPADGEEAIDRTPLAEAIRNRVEAAAGLPDRLFVGDERVHASATLSAFYEGRGYEPAWVDEGGVRPAARRLLDALADAGRDGLRPSDYHEPEIREQVAALEAASGIDAGRLVDLEMLLTDGFLLFGSHLLAGHLDAATLHPNWRAERRERDLAALLEKAAGGDPARVLRELRPAQHGYRRLTEALEAFRAVEAAGGWPTVPEGEQLAPGDTSSRLPALRARLAAVPEAVAGALGPPDLRIVGDTLVYDSLLADAVRAFQRRHGLTPDALVGPATLAALNATAGERIRQIEVNLERWRWLPEELGERHVLVNTADFRLDAVEDGEVALTMRAIVGKPFRQTPVFSDRISYMVFSPYWHVPHTLAVQDHLPLQKRDPTYFQRLGFRLFRGWGADAAEVDPATVDWSSVTARNFGFRLRQDPGRLNFLGSVKFMFPNPWNVYLHDTPARELFGRTARSFSSGCIRLEKPRELALWLLRGDRQWTPERVDRAMAAGREETARLASPVPVHLLYWTAFVGEDGTVEFRPDVYGRDAPVARALEREPPASASPVAVPPLGAVGP